MTDTNDPFVRHPELRDRIACSESSFHRNFDVESLIRHYPQLEQYGPWVHTDAQREQIRAQALRHHEGDLWIFAYGSLMWDPALRFQ